jgi:hypothetical protein
MKIWASTARQAVAPRSRGGAGGFFLSVSAERESGEFLDERGRMKDLWGFHGGERRVEN